MNNPPQLYLTLDIGPGDAAAAEMALQAALDAAEIASILIRARPGTDLDAALAKAIAGAAQKRGIAVMVADDAKIARMIKADGLHISWSKDTLMLYREARAFLGERAMIGADAGRSRDDAMLLGEAGADYIAFGIPNHVEDRATAEDRQSDLIAWWSEIFEIPCVACDVASLAQAHRLAIDGADFIAISTSAAAPSDEISRTVAAYAQTVCREGADA